MYIVTADVEHGASGGERRLIGLHEQELEHASLIALRTWQSRRCYRFRACEASKRMCGDCLEAKMVEKASEAWSKRPSVRDVRMQLVQPQARFHRA
jgi:hypothetical protein